MLGSVLLCPPVVNMVFEAISVLSDEHRLSFVRLLSSLVRMRVIFHARRAAVLRRLMHELKAKGRPRGLVGLLALNPRLDCMILQRTRPVSCLR